MGSIPVYGAQDMGISPEAGYSVEGTELSQTEEALSGETALQETADTSNEENVEEDQKRIQREYRRDTGSVRGGTGQSGAGDRTGSPGGT